jgi:DNA ligase (NAD+)
MDVKIATLSTAIDKADQAYHRHGNSALTDAEYDALKAELRHLDPDNSILKRVGIPYSADELKTKVEHEIPVGSLENTEGGISGIESWVEKITEKLGTNDYEIIASHKLDGCTAVATYENGELVRVVTRGNGEVGEDITANAIQWKGMPTKLPIDASLIVRGEVIMFKGEFDAHMAEKGRTDKDISNPRNIGSGIISRKDGQYNHKMNFIAFNLADPNEGKFELSMVERYKLLRSFGFQVVFNAPVKATEINKLVKFCQDVEESRDNLEYEIDGVVIVLNDYAHQQTLDPGSLRPKHSRAVKFTSKKAITKILDVEITIGHQQNLAPTAILEKVRVGGVYVEHAFLCNWNEIEKLGVAIGDTVEVELAGDIIPKVVRLVEEGKDRREIVEPEEFNGFKTTRMIRGNPGAVTYLVGAGDSPEIRKKKVKRWIGTAKKGVGILGIGDKVLNALCDSEDALVNGPADLYRLTEADLVDLPIGTNAKGGPIRLGEKRARSLLENINVSKVLPLKKFLGSIGVDLLGTRRVEELSKDHNLLTVEDWLDKDKTNAISGDTLRKAIQDGLSECSPLIEELLGLGIEVLPEEPKKATPEPSEGGSDSNNSDPFAGKTFCFTGTRDCVNEVEARGGVIKSGISKKLDYLVQQDPMSRSNKSKKAEEYGVEILGVEFLQKVLAGEAEL